MNGRTNVLTEQVQIKLSKLPKDKVVEVLDFVEFLLQWHSSPETLPHPQKGSREALLRCAGIWQFEPDELDEFLADIEQGRLMELEEENERLFA